MIDAWFSWSLMITSSSVSRVAGNASLAFQQLTKLSDAGGADQAGRTRAPRPGER
jgi:hypothetical protein